MAETWGETGVGKIFQHKLSKSTKEHIKREIESDNKQAKYGYEELFSALEIAVAQFKSQKDLAERSSPSATRSNLENALNAALKLNDALNDLDGNARLLLGKYKGILELQGTHLSAIIADLNQARLDANKYPSRGRLPDSRRIILALQLDHIFSAHLDCPLRTTKVSSFSNLFTLVYQEATGKSEVKDVSELLREANKWERIEHPGGGIEFCPKKTN